MAPVTSGDTEVIRSCLHGLQQYLVYKSSFVDAQCIMRQIHISTQDEAQLRMLHFGLRRRNINREQILREKNEHQNTTCGRGVAGVGTRRTKPPRTCSVDGINPSLMSSEARLTTGSFCILVTSVLSIHFLLNGWKLLTQRRRQWRRPSRSMR